MAKNNSNGTKKLTFGGVESDYDVESIIGSAKEINISDLRDGQGLAVKDCLGDFGKVLLVSPMENNENARVIKFEDGHVVSTTCASWNPSKAYSFADKADEESFKAWVKNYKPKFKTEKQFLTSPDWKKLRVKDIKSFKLVARDGQTEYNKNFVMFE